MRGQKLILFCFVLLLKSCVHLVWPVMSTEWSCAVSSCVVKTEQCSDTEQLMFSESCQGFAFAIQTNQTNVFLVLQTINCQV